MFRDKSLAVNYRNNLLKTKRKDQIAYCLDGASVFLNGCQTFYVQLLSQYSLSDLKHLRFVYLDALDSIINEQP